MNSLTTAIMAAFCAIGLTGSIMWKEGPGGGAPTADFSQSFEAANPTPDCATDEASVSEETGAVECNCQTGSGCVTTPRPSTIPDGSEVADVGNLSTESTVKMDLTCGSSGQDGVIYWDMCINIIDDGNLTNTSVVRMRNGSGFASVDLRLDAAVPRFDIRCGASPPTESCGAGCPWTEGASGWFRTRMGFDENTAKVSVWMGANPTQGSPDYVCDNSASINNADGISLQAASGARVLFDDVTCWVDQWPGDTGGC